MDIILCHTTADFDSLGAAVGLTRLHPGARIVLTGGAHPGVEEFLRLHRDEYAIIERRSVNPEQLRSLFVVDTQSRDRLGKAAEWFDAPQLQGVYLYDHHPGVTGDIPASQRQIEAIGATTTLIVEQLQQQNINLTVHEATVMALGIHVDSGSLTFDHSTARDALALAWLMKQGASLTLIAEYIEPGLSDSLQDLLATALETVNTEDVWGQQVASVVLRTPDYVPGLSGLTSRLLELTDTDALILLHEYQRQGDESRLTVIARSQIPQTDLNAILQPIGGGGHRKAGSAQLRNANPDEVLRQLGDRLKAQIPPPPTARELMSSPVRTIRPSTTIGEAHRILLRYGHSGLSVVNQADELVGIISRRDLDIALHHGFHHAPVKGYMTRNVKTISPDTLLPEIEGLMVTFDIGRLPVLDKGALVGIVTRTDVLRELHEGVEAKQGAALICPLPPGGAPGRRLTREGDVWDGLRSHLNPNLWQLLETAAQAAQERGWQLYLVGGAVRDLLRVMQSPQETQVDLTDIDLVVDGFHQSATVGAGVELANVLQEQFSGARLDVHGAFQTAALLWHNDPIFDSLWLDIATARTEFYPYPAANPEVEASSIRQDLYRRDFTINALAIRLTTPRQGKLLDFFGGVLDLQQGWVRVLHANSFIEDPTRIFRAVRFAVRFEFEIEPETERFIRHAIASGVYERSRSLNPRTPALQARLTSELKYLLQASYWPRALRELDRLGALQCLHPQLRLTRELWRRLQLADRGLRRFQNWHRLSHWRMLLEVLLSHVEMEDGEFSRAAVSVSDRRTVAQQLQLPEETVQRLATLGERRERLERELRKAQRPSEVVRVLSGEELAGLLLVALGLGRSLRRKIWHYLTEWAQVKPLLNGEDLKRLGYKPGPHFKEMLADIQAGTLDGVFGGSREAAISFVCDRYPLSPSD
ncbi:MAG: CBS domain-containing protein [Phormidium sp. BM_Day4_Bin.17]|nr:CBS domain-containing protein [Phormidium sp. BM_Day4_Bin.17]UCJ14461.1 MAG: CBS domain-containing protein [Phormidium sp. PBR-2020]